VERLGLLKISLSRTIVFGDWDAWTLIPVSLALLALLAAFAYYFLSLYRRLKSPAGVNWDAELGVDSRRPPLSPRGRVVERLKLAGISFFALFMGMGALVSGHFTSREHGHRYSAEGASARVAGVILCAAGTLLGLAALFQDSKVLNRPLGEDERKS
jgi:hypothetical protein